MGSAVVPNWEGKRRKKEGGRLLDLGCPRERTERAEALLEARKKEGKKGGRFFFFLGGRRNSEGGGTRKLASDLFTGGKKGGGKNQYLSCQ